VNEAGVARFALELLIRYRAKAIALDLEKLGNALSTIVRHHAPLLHSSEVAWALWAAIAFELALPAQDIRMAVSTGDPVCRLLALDAHSRQLVDFDLPAEIAASVMGESFRSEHWLLLYKAVFQGWLAPGVVASDACAPFFQRLMDLGVSFYDSEVELDKINRGADDLRMLDLPVLAFVFGY
jgi:hypothetical protein